MIEDVLATPMRLDYELDESGEPILQSKRHIPKLVLEETSGIPIMGLPLITFDNEKEGDKERSDKLWGLFANMIVEGALTGGQPIPDANEDEIKTMLITKIIDKHEEV